jgi:general L-amino acid transport system substrate-binding protein
LTKKLMLLLMALMLAAAACTADGGDEDPAGDDVDQALPTDGATDGTDTADAGTDTGGEAGEGLQSILDRGNIVCGVNDAVPGFGFTDEGGEFSGFDIDYCRAFAAGLFGDPEAVEFRPLTADQRFTALASGEIDVLVRNTTYTATRDGAESATFLTTTFYDGQGMMVRSGEFSDIDDMDGTDICVLQGTTTEVNLSARFANMDFNPVTFPDNDTLQAAFVEGRCDGWTSDKSQLAGVRSNFPDGPEALEILEETFSKEPLGPAVRDGESGLAQALNWIVYATFIAEELGITQDNVSEMADIGEDEPNAADIKALLGQPVGEDNAVIQPGLGLDDDFALNVIEAVGNYGEIYDRNVGPDTALGLERGVNSLWTEGGLIYAPPYR